MHKISHFKKKLRTSFLHHQNYAEKMVFSDDIDENKFYGIFNKVLDFWVFTYVSFNSNFFF